MRSFKRNLLAGAITFAVSAPAAAQFTDAYFFGDSVSDVGNQYVSPGRALHDQSRSHGRRVREQHWGLTTTPSFQGGNNYAAAGAVMNSRAGYPRFTSRPSWRR